MSMTPKLRRDVRKTKQLEKQEKRIGRVTLEFQDRSYILGMGDTLHIFGQVDLEGDARGTIDMIPYEVKVLYID